MAKPYYYVSGVVVTGNPAYFQIMEESETGQVCIATVPFNSAVNPEYSRVPARKDADLIIKALNAYQG